MLHLCAGCGLTLAPYRCGRCKLREYCSTTCQEAHWKLGHESACLGELLRCDGATIDSPWIAAFVHGTHARPIGGGGTGIVWANDDHPRWVVKLAKGENAYLALRREFRTICEIKTGITWQSDVVRMVEAPVVTDETERPAFVMEHVFRPRGMPNDPIAVHVYSGMDVGGAPRLVLGRGYYVDVTTAATIVGHSPERIVHEIARFVGTLQFNRARWSANDLEYIIGTTAVDPVPRIYVIDYDKCTSWAGEQDVSALVAHFAWAMESEPYLPTDPEHPLHAAFKEGYFAAARANEQALGLAHRIYDHIVST